jgi:hypothetical protein
VEEALLGLRSSDRPESPKVIGVFSGGRSDHCRISPSYTAAAGRLPVRASADHPASYAVVIASLSATAWDWTVAEIGGDKPAKKKFKPYPIGFFHIDIAEVVPRRVNSIFLWPSTAHPGSHSCSSFERADARAACAFLEVLAVSSSPICLSACAKPMASNID